MAQQLTSEVYRAFAAKELGYADEARFPIVREHHERAAKRWVEMAERLEGTCRTNTVLDALTFPSLR